MFTDVKPDMCSVREEIFGPVVTVERFDTYQEAATLANGTAFGLVATVYLHQRHDDRGAPPTTSTRRRPSP